MLLSTRDGKPRPGEPTATSRKRKRFENGVAKRRKNIPR